MNSQSNVRGVPPAVILDRWGAVLDLNGTTRDFTETQVTTKTVDVFFSHVWGARRASRFLGILWYLNASAVMLLATVIIFCVCIVLAFTVDGRRWFRFEKDTKLTGQSVMALGGTFLVVILFVSLQRFLHSALLFRPRLCFLDRCCITQGDQEEKLRGIRQIPVILSKSRRLVVLLSDHYFERLWCCYELAVFRSSMNAESKIIVIHLRVVTLTILITLFALLNTVLFASSLRSALARNSEGAFLGVNALFSFLSAVLAYSFSWYWFSDLEKFKRQLSSFSLVNAKCSDEDDRAELTLDIARRFGGIAPFEAYVQNELVTEITARPKVRFMLFMALPAVFSVLAYVMIINQRLGLFCMAELSSTQFVRKDDLICVILTRETWENIFVMVCELVQNLCYYPVLISTVLVYHNRVQQITSGSTSRWPRYFLDIGGVLILTGVTMVEHMQFSELVLFHSIKTSILIILVAVYYLGPYLRQRTGNKSSEIFHREDSSEKVIKVE